MAVVTSTLDTAVLHRFCALAGPGELTVQQVRQQRPDRLLTLESGGALVARLSLSSKRVPDYPGERLGLIGHYAAADGDAAAEILASACDELSRHGATLAVGPLDGSTWRRYRLVTERGAEPPFFLEPDNPDEWPHHFEAAGFTPLARYYSAMNDDIGRPWPLNDDAAAGFTLRPFEPAQSEQELQRLWAVATAAFVDNFLYTPIEQEEFYSLYRPLLPLLRPELVLIAERQGRAVAFCFAIPDLLQAQRGIAVDTVIIKTIAVLPEYRRHGLGTLLIARVTQIAAQLGMRRSILALMHEANPSRRFGHGLMREFRRYTLFARPL